MSLRRSKMIALWVPALAILLGQNLASRAAERTFQLGGQSIVLEDVSDQAPVYFRSMRLNRVLDVWNVEATVTNLGAAALNGPLVLLVESFTNTSGLLVADGSADGKSFLDLSAQLDNGALSQGEGTVARTLTLGRSGIGAPSVVARVFARQAQPVAGLQVVRTLDDAGLPLPSVTVDSPGAPGVTAQTDDAFGLATLTQTNQTRALRFSVAGYLPVWRNANVTSNGVGVIPHPRLTRRDTNPATLTPIAGGTLSRGSPPVEVSFTPGTFSQDTTARLTPLTGQTLPLFLPPGWSPLSAFWLELSAEPALVGNGTLTPSGPIPPGETAAFVRLNANTPVWEVLQLVNGNGSNAVNVALPGSGAYALVVPDAAPIAPPNPTVGSVLPPSATSLPDAAGLRAGGMVTPSTSRASKVPELVTATAEVLVTNVAGNLPSGTLLRGEVSERYTLRDGTRRFPASFDNFVVGYQRPGDALLDTVRAEFPIRPLLLFGAEELQEALVHTDLFPPGAFTGGILDTNGGQVASAGLRVLAGVGDLLGNQAVQLKRLDVTNFTELAAGSNAIVVAAFEIGVNGVAAGRKLVVQLSGLATSADFVLARVLAREGLYGLEPRERLHSDGAGNLFSDEPATGEKLPGLNGAGQYVLLKINPPQGLVSGVARNSSGQPTGGLPIRILGQPWLTFSANDGAFKLLSPAGDATLTVNDLASGDSGTQSVNVPNPQTPVNTQLASVSSGPRVISVSPANYATGVSRVTPIVIEFSEPVNPGTVIGPNIQLLDTNGTLVTASLTLNLKNTIATLLPTDPLSPSTQFAIQVSTNIADLAGLKLEDTNRFSFMTESDALNRSAADVVMYEPTNRLARVTGGPGMAEPNAAVILVNENSGATATVPASADGSFDNFIEADVEDELSAVIVNANGTRNKFRASKQLFRDGSVGLFNQGGTIDAPGEGGTFQLTIPAGVIKNKSVVKLTPMTLQAVTNSLANLPTDAQVIAGMQISVKNPEMEGSTEISIPIDPARINLPDNSPPEDGAYALAMVRELETGGTVYQVVDKLRYENGRLFSNTQPHKSWGESFTDAIANNPIGVLGLLLNPVDAVVQATFTVLVLGTRPVTVTGKVGLCPAPPGQSCLEEQLDPFFQAFQALPGILGQVAGGAADAAEGAITATRRPLPGAFITLQLPQTTAGRTGRLQAGIAYTTSDRKGIYALVLPTANAGFILNATHPRFADNQSTPLRPTVDYQLGQGAVRKNFSFAVPIATDAAPRVDVSHGPLYPQTNQQATLTVDVIHPSNPPIIVLVDGVDPPGGGSSVNDVQLTGLTPIQISPSQRRIQATATCSKVLTARIKISSTVATANGGSTVIYHYIPFGQVPATVTNAPIQSDPEDKTGPQIERTEPLPGGVLQFAQPVVLLFNEPIDASVAQQATQFPLNNAQAGLPFLTLSPDQTRVELRYPGLKADTEYELSVNAPIKDLAGNNLVVPPTSAGGFKLKFRTLPVANTTLSGVGHGGGVVVHRNFAYVLDRTGDGKLFVYDISNPSQPNPVSQAITFIGDPRDLVVLPAWPHVRTKTGTPQTSDLLAVVGGNLGTSSTTGNPGESFTDVNIFFQGQYLRVFDITDPANPVRILGAALTLRPDAVTKVRWDPPNLTFLEIGSDLQRVGLIDLQEMLVGFNATATEAAAFPLFGIKGIDGVGTNAPDGDYVDAGERVPTPPKTPNEFFGLKRSFLPDRTFGARIWTDFDYKRAGEYCGVVFREGKGIDDLGNPTSNMLPPGYRTLALGEDLDSPSATVAFGFGANPKRVFAMLNTNISTNEVPDVRNIALVSLSPDSDGKSKLAIIDITQPNAPAVVNKIELPPQFNLGFAQSIRRRPDGLLALATTTDLVLLDQRKFLVSSPSGSVHPAILGIVPGAGSGNISLGQSDAGVNAVALGGRNQLVQEAPELQFVRVFLPTVTDPSALANNATLRQQVFDAMLAATVVGPARFSTNGGVPSTLDPANPTNHYHVLAFVPGGAGGTISLGLQSLNRSGYPLKNKGRNFAPVRAVSSHGSQLLGQAARAGCDAPINALTAYRLAGNDPKDPFYNVYLSKPFALTYERIPEADINNLKNSLDREILWSDYYIEAFIDPQMQFNPVLGPFAAQVGGAGNGTDKVLQPRSSVVAESFPGTYIPGPNPPPVSGPDKMPGTFATISAHNGEFRHDTIDVALPGRRMPIVFERVIGGQDLYEGPFGRGWDFPYNQRLTPLRPEIIGRDHRLPLIIRALTTESTKAEPGDLLWHTGRGRLVLYKNKGDQPPSDVATDPLLNVLQWVGKIRAYYLPATNEAAIFDPLFEFHDGHFARLTPDGRQFWYSRQGRLEKIYHRYVKNFHKLVYNQRGELIKIVDGAIANDQRFLEIGHYRLEGDAEFISNLDEITPKIFVAGKIARIKDYTGSAGRVVDFFYTDDGILEKRLGFLGSPANNGDGGRPETVYLYTDNCSGFLQGVKTGGALANSQLFAVGMNPNTGVVNASGSGASGPVSITPPPQNDAASVGGSQTSTTGPDGATTDFTFDKFGFPSKTEYGGSGAPNATLETTYGPYGLLLRVKYPMGNAVEYAYDTNNVLLRARANLLTEKRTPGPRPGDILTRTIASYDLRYNLPNSTMTDFNLKTITFVLTGDGRDMDTVDYDGAGIRNFDYNPDYGEIEKETTPEGIVFDPDFDNTTGFKTSEKRGSITTATYGYDSSTAGKLGIPTSVTLGVGDPINNIKYDDRLLLLEFQRGAYSEKRGYDRNGNPKYIERELGGGRKLMENRTYNEVNFLEKIIVQNVEINGAGAPMTTEFKSSANDAWRTRRIIYPEGQTKEFDYDHLGNIIHMKLGGYEETYGRDLHGNLTSLKQGSADVRSIGYDGHDRIIGITNLIDGSTSDTTTFSYYGNGPLKDLVVTSPTYGVVREEHVSVIDGLGRPKQRRLVGSNGDADYQYDYPAANGGQIITTGPLDTETLSFDATGRRTAWGNAAASLTFTPDGNGNILSILSMENNQPYSTTYGYDGLDHMTSQSDPISQVTKLTPLADGAASEVFDGRNKLTTQTFTVLGERSSIKRPSGVEFVFHYDGNRQQTLAGDTTLSGHQHTYDSSTFRATSQSLRSGASFTYADFNDLNLPETAGSPVGDMTFAYDLQGRLIALSAEHGQGEKYDVSFKRDSFGRIREAKYGKAQENTATYTYDKLGPMTSATFAELLDTFTVSSTINADRSRATLTYPSGPQLTEGRDNAGRLMSVSESGDIYRIQNYLGVLQPGDVVIGGGLITEKNSYDARRRLVARRYERAGALLADVRYQYDFSDNREVRQEVHRHGRADLFTYDDDSRLTRADLGARPGIPGAIRNGATQLRQDFGFSAGFFARIYGYGGLDLLTNGTAINPDALLLPPMPPFAQSLSGHDSMLFALQLDGGNRPAPDGLGNTMGTTLFVRLPGATEPTSVSARLTYNGRSQLVSVMYTNQGTPVLIEYQHQPGNLMHYRKVTVGGTVISERALIYDRDLLLEEYENLGAGNTDLIARYYYADEDSPFAADLADAQGNLNRFYYLRDAQGSVMAVADDSGTVVERISYDAWGQPMIQGRDTNAPRVAAITVTGTDELLVQFTEPILPPLAGAGPGIGLVTGAVGLGNVFQLNGPGGPISLDPPVFEENLAAGALSFGTTIRLRAQQNLPANLTLHVVGGTLVDEWGLGNPDQQIGFTLTGTNAAPLGSTAPPRLARSTVGSPFLFHGQYFDYDAGLLYLRARFYDPYTGSFMQQDPEGYQDSVNLYAGFRHNPTSRRDPAGTATPIKKTTVKSLPSGGRSPTPSPHPSKGSPPPSAPPHPRTSPANQNAGTLHRPVPGEAVGRGIALDDGAAQKVKAQIDNSLPIESNAARNGVPIQKVVESAEEWRGRVMSGTGKDSRKIQQTLKNDPTLTALLAESHISGAGDKAPGVSFAQDPHFAATWGLRRANDENGILTAELDAQGSTVNPAIDPRWQRPYLIIMDPNHPKNNGTTYRGTNLEEGDEVTFIFEAHYREAVLYEIRPKLPGKEATYNKATDTWDIEGGYDLIEVARSRGPSID